MGTKYFLDSVNQTKLYFEGKCVEDGKLTAPAEKAVHKIGHGIHVEVPAVRDITFSDKMKKSVKALTGFDSAKILQSMFLLKQASVGEASPIHIDESYLMTSPPGKVAGVWIALDDSLVSNGCLEFLPGSHRTHVVNKTWTRKSKQHEPGHEWE